MNPRFNTMCGRTREEIGRERIEEHGRLCMKGRRLEREDLFCDTRKGGGGKSKHNVNKAWAGLEPGSLAARASPSDQTSTEYSARFWDLKLQDAPAVPLRNFYVSVHGNCQT